MLQKVQKRKEDGFTIIEVLIVLAIAGLILLVVFLAVPALQRNSRNTQRRQDVSVYLSAVNEFIDNNAGQLPTTAANVTSINSLAKLTLLAPPTGVPPTGAQTSAIGVDNMQLVTGAKCDTSTIGNTAAGAGRQYAMRYAVEGSGGTAIPQCTDS